MSAGERDEPFATLPDLGEYHVRGRAAHKVATGRTREAVACVIWHREHEHAHRRDWLAGYVACAFALASLLVALLTVRESWAGLLGVGCVAAIVTSAWRSGSKVTAERDHHAACGACPGGTS